MLSSIRKRYVAVLLVPLFLWVVVLASSEPNAADAPPASLPLPDPIERDLDAIRAGDTLTVLTTYNTGHGHVEDARRLAVKHGDDPDRWEDVAYWLLQKSKRAVYTDPVVKYGFARGLGR